MAEPPFDLKKAHRWFAVEFNNYTWDLLESDIRSPEVKDEMLLAAHAACLHWRAVGNSLNELRAQHLLATVYAETGFAERATYHAELCAKLASEEGDESPSEFDQASIQEALARAAACRGELETSQRYREKARQLASNLPDEDKEVFESMLQMGEWYGVIEM